MKVGVIGGGASGFFTAINIAEKNPNAKVTILEKSKNVLAKVKVSGSGRCNVTNGRTNVPELSQFYPRGKNLVKHQLNSFGTDTMREWLKDHGVPTKVEDDLRVFPTSNSSQTIIACFLSSCQSAGIRILRECLVTGIAQKKQWIVKSKAGEFSFDKIVIATGSTEQAWKWLSDLGLDLKARVPSLFTFNISDRRLENLQGIAFANATVKVVKSKLKESGPLLITHWGLSGPAILKLSAWGAYELEKNDYKFQIIANVTGNEPAAVLDFLNHEKSKRANAKLKNIKIANCPNRYLQNLINHLGIDAEKRLGDLSKKEINRLVEELSQALFQVDGKSTFKEEFVTCGGVDLKEINPSTMESRRFPGLYLSGEVLNIDALTAGFNFQACWSAAWIISEQFKHDNT